MWKVKKYNSNEEEIWYSAEEYNELKEKLANYENLLYNKREEKESIERENTSN